MKRITLRAIGAVHNPVREGRQRWGQVTSEIELLPEHAERRPNPIGLTTVRLLGRKGNALRVKGLDALDGTPVLDIKPYSPRLDAAPGARLPKWVEALEKSLEGERQGD